MGLRHRLLFYACLVLLIGLIALARRTKNRTFDGESVVRHWDWFHGAESRWIEREILLFEREYPGVQVQRVNVQDWQRYREILGASIEAHGGVDVFFMPRRVGLGELVRRGWVVPLDKLADEQWRTRYPAGALSASSYRGRIYSFPIEGAAGRVRVLIANRRAFLRAGLVNANGDLPEIRTWDDLVQVSQRLTLGSPRQWGFGFGGKSPGGAMDYWLDLAQAGGGFYYYGGLDGFDPRTGRYEYGINPAYAGAIRVLLALRDQGSLAPGTMSIRQDDALRELAAGRFGLTFGTLSDLRTLAEIDPTLEDMEVLRLPRPEPTSRCSWFQFGVGRTFHLAPRASPLALQWLRWLSGTAASRRWVASGLGPTVLVRDTSKDGEARPAAYTQFVEIAEGESCIAPNPARRRPEFEQLRIRPTTPDAADVVEGALVGRLDMDSALRALDMAKDHALQDARRALAAEGIQLQMEDLIFRDWPAHRQGVDVGSD